MIVVTDEREATLPPCPHCDGPLRPWGFARARRIRLAGARSRQLTPRRARCRSCATTHVLLPAWCLPRRADSVEVIGAALVGRARGAGISSLAAELDRPPATVRGWIRRAQATCEFLRDTALRHLIDLNPHFPPFGPQASPLAEALDAVAACAYWAAKRLALPRLPSPWQLAVVLTQGLWLSRTPAY
jgi:hypothetical protein